MTDNDFDRTARAWLEDGPTRISDRAVLSALEEIHSTRQRRSLWPARRRSPISVGAPVAVAAALVVAAGLLALDVARRQPDGSNVDGPSPSPSTTPREAIDFPELTTTFVSPRNGFSIRLPDGAAVTPAVQLWGLGEQADDGFDVVETGLRATFKGASIGSEFGGEGSIDQRVDEYLSSEGVLPGGCDVPRREQAAITIDGRSGRIAECPNRIEATVVVGARLYLFTLEHDRRDARAVFDAFVATIDLAPETAVAFPAMTMSFVSPTYGYSFAYFRGIRAATEVWDPGNQPLDDRDFDPRFDANETGWGAYFEGASTTVPDGVSIDDWVDEYVTPLAAGGCGVPRSQQAEITIDGLPARMAQCEHSEATVVAGGRLYLFTGPHDTREWFEAWLGTIDLRPEDAVARSSTP